MAHIHIIEDKQGDMIDQKIYCSDSCNTYDNQENYQGWNGCHESEFDSTCGLCGSKIHGFNNQE